MEFTIMCSNSILKLHEEQKVKEKRKEKLNPPINFNTNYAQK